MKNLIRKAFNNSLIKIDFEKSASEKEQPMKYHNITIFKQKRCNSYYCRYRMNGKQYFVSAKTQAKCLEKLKEALNLPKRERRSPHSFISWYEKWFELFKKNVVKFETVRDYNVMLRKIPEDLKLKSMGKITSLEILHLLEKEQKERSKQKLYEFLRAIWTKAKDYKVVNDNIFDVIEKPKHVKSKGIALTNNQQSLFEELCKNAEYGDLFLIMMYQGLRIGEVLALTGNDIQNNQLIINKQLTARGVVPYTKNIQSTRTIPIFNKTSKIINKYLDYGAKRLFNVTSSAITKVLKKIINGQLPNISSHDLRHTFITNCQNKGIPEHVIQAIVGHEIGSSVTRQVYTHFNLDDNLSYINKINEG